MSYTILIRLLIFSYLEMEKRTDFYDFIDKIQRQDKYIEYIEEENRKLKEKVKELEEWLDRKEEINKKLRSDLLMYQNQYWCLTD